MTEHETSEQGFCPDCKSPSHTGSHTTGCTKNNTQADKGDERLSLDEAQEEARKVRDYAIDKRAEDYLGKEPSESEYSIGQYHLGYSGAKYMAEDLHQESLSEHRDLIYKGKAKQPSKENYERAEKDVEYYKKVFKNRK